MPASQRFHHGEQGNQIYLGDREALPSLTLHYVQRAAVQGASLLPSIIFGGSSAPQILRSGLLGRTFNRDCSWHQGLAYKSRSLYRSKKFFKNGSNNSEKFTSSVKIIVMTSSRAGIKKNSPQVELERGNLEQVLYMDYYNDIAVMVNDQFILMIEHQSTINPNMPLRLLEYVTRIYGNKVDSKTKFSNKLIPLAKPEFFVFYTGKENIPPESYLYLSDAFWSKK